MFIEKVSSFIFKEKNEIWFLCHFSKPSFTCLKSTMETLKRRHEACSKLTIKKNGVFVVNFEQNFTPFSNASIADFEQVNDDWAAATQRITCVLKMNKNFEQISHILLLFHC